MAGDRRLSYANGSSEHVVAVRVQHEPSGEPWEAIWVKRDTDHHVAELVALAPEMAEAILAWCATDAEIAAELGDLHPGETDEAWIREMHAMGDKLRALHAAQETTR